MVIECESSTDVEIIVGTYEEFVLGYKALKTEDGHLDLTQSFANHSHRASVRCVAASGRFMASGGADDLIQLYDMKLRKEMGVLMHHERTVTCLAFVHSSHLASGSDDGELAIWRTGSWQCEKILTAHRQGGITAVAVHPSGKLCLSAGKDRALKTWNLVKGRPAYTTNLHAQAEALAWSPSGDHYAVVKLVNGGAQYAVDVYAVAMAGVVYSFVPEHRPASICFLEDDVAAVGCDGGKVELHSVAAKCCLCSFKAHEGRVRCIDAVRFKTGDMWLVTAASNGGIGVWKYKEREEEGAAASPMVAPKQLGSLSAGCRITCMAVVKTPDGAARWIKKSPEEVGAEVEDIKEEVRPVARPSKHMGHVTIELDESDDEPAPASKNKRKLSDQSSTTEAVSKVKSKSGQAVSKKKGKSDQIVSKKIDKCDEVVSKKKSKSDQVVSKQNSKSVEIVSKTKSKSDKTVSKKKGKSDKTVSIKEKMGNEKNKKKYKIK